MLKNINDYLSLGFLAVIVLQSFRLLISAFFPRDEKSTFIKQLRLFREYYNNEEE